LFYLLYTYFVYINVVGYMEGFSGESAGVGTSIAPQLYECTVRVKLKTRRDGEGGGPKTVDTANYRFARPECSDVE
jgi:hypothetical protein